MAGTLRRYCRHSRAHWPASDASAERRRAHRARDMGHCLLFRVRSGANTQTLEEREILLTVGRPILARNKQEKLIKGAFNLHNEPDGLCGSRFPVVLIVAVESTAIPARASKLELSTWLFAAESNG